MRHYTAILISSFVLTLYKNSPIMKNKLFTTVLRENLLSGMFWVFQKQTDKEKCGTVIK